MECTRCRRLPWSVVRWVPLCQVGVLECVEPCRQVRDLEVALSPIGLGLVEVVTERVQLVEDGLHLLYQTVEPGLEVHLGTG